MITKNILMEAMMKIRALVPVLMLIFFALSFIPGPAYALSLTISPTEGPVGTEVTIQGLNLYGSGQYSLYWGDSKQPIKQGTDEGSNLVTFSVPQAARGEHAVALKIEGKTFETEFTVIPSISADIEAGTVGSQIVLKGNGFNVNENDIAVDFDDIELATGVTADKYGNWESICEIPASPLGAHSIIAYGTTPIEEVQNLVFNVIPLIKITPNSGGVGTMVAIAGTGFGSAETGIVVTYDGILVKTAISSDARGSWNSSFYAPSSAKGKHSIDSYGAKTDPEEVANVTYTISPGMRLEMVSGNLGDTIHTGDTVWVSGIGFEENETGIGVVFDGTLVASGIVADATGSWAVQINVPLGVAGEHKVDASGKTTGAGDVPDTVLVLSPRINIEPREGAIGEQVVVSGTAFGMSQALTISYDGNLVAAGTKTDAKGSFTANFEIPATDSGDHTITVTDALAAVASTSFTVESNPPPVPELLLPKPGSRTGFIGKTTLEFDWSDVQDPSGVTYLLEVSENAEFTVATYRKSGLTESQYMLAEDEALNRGTYYWRVKAIDDAGNESDWSTAQVFYIGVMEWWHLIAIIIGGIVLLLVIVRLVIMGIRRAMK
jgi:hypothetical protein